MSGLHPSTHTRPLLLFAGIDSLYASRVFTPLLFFRRRSFAPAGSEWLQIAQFTTPLHHPGGERAAVFLPAPSAQCLGGCGSVIHPHTHNIRSSTGWPAACWLLAALGGGEVVEFPRGRSSPIPLVSIPLHSGHTFTPTTAQ